MRELGLEKNVIPQTDSSAAKSFSSQRGVGRVRHIEVKSLWLQESVCRGRLRIEKISGIVNPADIFTKYLSARDSEAQCSRCRASASEEVVLPCVCSFVSCCVLPLALLGVLYR